ncbi:MAG TPA: hypothetical protein VFT48_13100 [Pyrinomonadaceae bacterium]|nr:hypothetical protein [Pyrinomonadaceae bacterium]
MKYRFDSAIDSPNLVTEPQFDDERTLLSARPVVPLEKINAKVRHRRQWILGGAFAIAMMLGAASALLASYLKMRNVQTVPAEITQVNVPEAPVAVAENPPAETPAVEETADTEAFIPAEESTPKKPPVKRKTVVAAKPDDYMGLPTDTRRVNEDDALHQIRDTVLYDEWQERRARRVWRRERRRAERYNNHRDLSNLDEIFEGRKRPNP